MAQESIPADDASQKPVQPENSFSITGEASPKQIARILSGLGAMGVEVVLYTDADIPSPSLATEVVKDVSGFPSIAVTVVGITRCLLETSVKGDGTTEVAAIALMKSITNHLWTDHDGLTERWRTGPCGCELSAVYGLSTTGAKTIVGIDPMSLLKFEELEPASAKDLVGVGEIGYTQLMTVATRLRTDLFDTLVSGFTED